MLKVKYKNITVFYTDELDGGGTTFGQDYLKIIPRLSRKKFDRVYEWCSGPGFIGFSLLAHGYCKTLCLSDVHPKAIEVIKKTIKFNNLENKVSVYLSDSLDQIPIEEKWDLVVGNPPHYSKKFKTDGLSEDQKRIVLDEGLNTHKKFFNKVGQHLNENGIILLQENWYRVARDIFVKMIEDNNLKFIFSSPFSNKFYYFCAAKKNGAVSYIKKQSWEIKYTSEDKSILKILFKKLKKLLN